MKRPICIAAAACLLSIALAGTSAVLADAPSPTPSPAAASPAASPTVSPATSPAASSTLSPATSPAASSTLSPAASQSVFCGQIIDEERGYVVFSTGDALRLAQTVEIVGDDSNAALARPVVPGDYGCATLDLDGSVLMLRVGDHPLAEGMPIQQVPRRFVVQLSPPSPNPDLLPPATLYPVSKLSKTEQVSITVVVPPQTPFSDDVYIATDTSGWNPQAIKMQRIDGRRFRLVIDVSPGTEFHYLFTRGSWTTVESDAAGLRRSPRLLNAAGGVALTVDASVRRWIDIP